MSRSFRHTPVFATTCCKSEKKDKKILHGKIRARIKQELSKDSENYVDPEANECYNIWSMGKDGKSYHTEEDVNHNPEYYKKLMRK